VKKTVWVVVVALGLGALCCRRTVAPRSGGITFAGFPIGKARTVTFEREGGALEGQSLRERREQVRDWLLYSVVAATGRSAEEISRMLYDLPALRTSYLPGVTNLPCGPARSVYLGSGHAVVLVPPENEAERFDRLAEAADEHRKNTGQMLGWLHVFEYQIEPGEQGARLTRLESVEARDLYTSGAGYREALLRSFRDLNSLIEHIEDLTFAQAQPNGLLAGGRKLRSRRYGRVRPEDVAAIYQSEGASRKTQRLVDEFNARWRSRSYRTPEEKAALEQQHALEQKELKAVIAAATGGTGVFKAGSGFSLDPVGVPPNYRYQTARYDGALQGTEVGMALFYTDLLAKLWALDFQQSFPYHISDFMPPPRVYVSPIFQKEMMQLSHTRLWFGPQDRGFQVTEAALLFGRTATRVYAVSSASGKTDEEVEPNAQSAAFLGWWNDHYDEVALWEPAYQRLNEIMKWSLLVSWLEAKQQIALLKFLEDVPVARENWFPAWARRQPHLRFTDWDHVGFHPRGYAGADTEAMEILRSEPYERFRHTWVLSGGVSLGSRKGFERRMPLLGKVGDLERRANVDYGASSGELRRVETYDKARYGFEGTGEHVRVTFDPRPDVRVRGPNIEFGGGRLETEFRSAHGGVQVASSAAGTGVASLELRARPDGYGVILRTRARRRAGALVDSLSQGSGTGVDPLAVMAAQPGVEMPIRLSGERGYLVAFRGENRWLKLEREATPGAGALQSGQTRMAGFGEDAGSYKDAWVEGQAVSAELGNWQFLKVEPAPGTPAGIKAEVSARGPPQFEVVTLTAEGRAPIRARRDAARALHFARSELPPGALENPRVLKEYLGPFRFNEFLHDVADGEYGRAAEALTQSPGEFKQQLDSFRARALDLGRQALTDADYSAAIRHLQPLAEVFRSDPDVQAPLALARLGRGDPARAVNALWETSRTPLREPARVFEQINGQLSRPGASQVERSNVYRLAQYLDYRELGARHPELKTAVSPFERGGQIDFIAYLPVVARRSVSASEALASQAAHYLDAPGFQNLEWTPGLGLTIDQLTARGVSSAVRIFRTETARLEPGIIEDAATRQRYYRIVRSGAGEAPARYEPYSANPCADCKEYVEVLRTNQALR